MVAEVPVVIVAANLDSDDIVVGSEQLEVYLIVVRCPELLLVPATPCVLVVKDYDLASVALRQL